MARSNNTVLIDGKQIAARLRAQLATQLASLKQDHGLVPGLAVVLVGDNPASQVYVRNKIKACANTGIQSFEHCLPANVTQKDIELCLQKLRTDSAVHGILVQLPLPKHLDTQAIINAIPPEKDVDGLHIINAGRLAMGQPHLIPCTPLGCMILLKEQLPDLTGEKAVIVGRSPLVGKPIAQLLLSENCTVTITHSKTQNLAEECRRADILIAAVGQPEMIRGDWIKPGAIVIDVGINRKADGKLTGDVCFEEAVQTASAITPVPGGVGPMTIFCLLSNTMKAACAQSGIAL